MNNSVATSQKVKEIPSSEDIQEAWKFLLGDPKEIMEGLRMGLGEALKEASVYEVERTLAIFNTLCRHIHARIGWITCLTRMHDVVEEYKKETAPSKRKLSAIV